MRLLRSLAASCLILLGACGDDGRSPDPASGTTSAGDDRFATTPVSVAGAQRGLLATVTAESTGQHERVTFTFEGALPGYRVAYGERPLVEDGSGDEVPVEGAAVLTVHFEPASGVELSGDQVRTTYTGPRRVRAGLSMVTEMVRVSDFEANLDWAVGLAQEVPFRVQALREPSRVVIDFQLPNR
ncbi:MAG: hypothetical protein KY454_13615 [Actinobacteria bacterium]|nr:hypothetical protein [Actinomycetota bacterium]MBW3649515.1 hypothetical protein [Actinomycetota bacterium]